MSGQGSAGTAGTIGIASVVVLLVVLAIAYYAGGSVAGRLARAHGALHGFGVWLIGIVVTNAIVLIDLINQYRARGEDLRTAITDGARLFPDDTNHGGADDLAR